MVDLGYAFGLLVGSDKAVKRRYKNRLDKDETFKGLTSEQKEIMVCCYPQAGDIEGIGMKVIRPTKKIVGDIIELINQGYLRPRQDPQRPIDPTSEKDEGVYLLSFGVGNGIPQRTEFKRRVISALEGYVQRHNEDW